MEFIFVCPKRNKTFISVDFSVSENRGVISDSCGSKMLDAKVERNEPCPFCGEKHRYRASELSCPLETPRNRGSIKRNQ